MAKRQGLDDIIRDAINAVTGGAVTTGRSRRRPADRGRVGRQQQMRDFGHAKKQKQMGHKPQPRQKRTTEKLSNEAARRRHLMREKWSVSDTHQVDSEIRMRGGDKSPKGKPRSWREAEMYDKAPKKRRHKGR